MSQDTAEPAASIQTSKLNVLRVICWLLVAGPVIFLSSLHFALPGQPRQALGPFLILVLAGFSLALIRFGREWAAAYLMIYGGWLAIAVHAFSSGGGIHTPQLAALPLGIVLSGWLLGARHAIAVTALGIGLSLALVLLPGSAASLPPLFVWLPRAVVAVGVCVLTLYIVRTYEEKIGEVHRLSEALARQAGALTEEKAQLHEIAENVPAMIFHGDRALRCRYANRQFADFFHGGGVPIEGMPLREILGDAVFDAALPDIGRVLAGESVLIEGERQSKAGEVRRLEISLVPERDEAGAVIGFYALKRDVTERKRIEEELHLSERKFSRVFHSSPTAISLTRMADGQFIDVNDAWTRLFGWSRAQVLGRQAHELGIWANPSDRQVWIAAALRTGRLENFEARLRDKDGRILSILFSSEVVELDGEPCQLALSIDLTEQKRTEAALAENEKRLREAQRIGHVGSWELDFSSRLLIWSDEIYRIYEMAPNTFSGRFQDLLERTHPDDRKRISDQYYNSFSVAGSYDMEHRIVTSNGRIKHVRIHWEMFLDEAGNPLRAIGTAQDITEHVLAQEEIRRLNSGLEQRVQERTAELTAANRELESFAYSISHDLRAPLRGIDGFSHLLAEEYGERLDETGRSYLDRVRRAAQRMGHLIDDILELSRVTRQEMRRVTVDLSQVATELLDEHARAEPAHRIAISIASGCTAQGDPQLLRVLMQNLLENAWKYSARQPSPHVEFGCTREDHETVFFVRDNGVGFDMQYADRLFAPFQRLHKPEEFEGTGIGLATVARVVHRHGGRVWAQSEPGKGATFRFILHAAPAI